jgi:hypothetical protein
MTDLQAEYDAIEDEEEKDEFYTVEEMEDEELEAFIKANLLGVQVKKEA